MGKINPKAWYLGVAIKQLYANKTLRRLHYKEFKSYSDVLYFMKINGKDNNLAYLPIKGEDAIIYDFSFIQGRSLRARVKRLLAYDYPIDKLTIQDRKSFRTKSRRWMRDYKVRLNTYNDFKRKLDNETISTNT